MAPDSVWEVVFLIVILKIPVVYLCLVVWWAIKAEPRPEEGAAITAAIGPDGDPPQRRRRGFRPPRRPRPWHGGPQRSYARTARASVSARPKLPRE